MPTDPKTKLFIEIEFAATPSTRAETDIRQGLNDFKDALEYLGAKIVKAELRKGADAD